MAIEPDTKDWTWVLDRRCDECGLEAGAIEPHRISELLRDNADQWHSLTDHAAAGWWQARPNASTWSPLEYAGHVRDVHGVFAERLNLMLTEDDPVFGDWDQDAAAIDANDNQSDPTQVLQDLRAAANHAAEQYQALTAEQWQRPGRRSDGAPFTGVTLARYHLHDVVHHLQDVRAQLP